MFTQKMMSTNEVKSQGAYPSWYEGTSPSENTGSPDMGSPDSEMASSPEERKMCTIMYCVPLISPYSSKLNFTVISNFFGCKTEFMSFQNNPKNLDPSYKTDLDLWDCLGRVKLVL